MTKTTNELIEELRAIASEPTREGLYQVERIIRDCQDPVVISYVVGHFLKYFRFKLEKQSNLDIYRVKKGQKYYRKRDIHKRVLIVTSVFSNEKEHLVVEFRFQRANGNPYHFLEYLDNIETKYILVEE